MIKTAINQSLLTLGLLAAVAPIQAETQTTGTERYLATKGLIQNAIRLLEERKLNDAKSILETCAQQIPDHYQAHFYLAQLDYENRDYPRALEHIQTAIRSLEELDRVYIPPPFEARKNAAEKRQEEQLNQTLITGVIMVGGERRSCKTVLASPASPAVPEFDLKASSSEPAGRPFAVPAAFYFVKGNCLLRLKRHAEAREQYTKAIQADPKHTDSWNNMAYSWFADQDRTAAMETLRQAEAKGITINAALRLAIVEAAKKGADK
jgi:tetratricopeptide (TPR) repeat protein